MGSGNNGVPTIDDGGETVDATTSDDLGEVQFEGPTDPDELMQFSNIRKDDTMTASPLGELGEEESGENDLDGLQAHLPDHADLMDDGTLRVENGRSQGKYDHFNGKRRFILKKLDEGNDPLTVAGEHDFADSYVYRARNVFNFLLEDALLRETFVEENGEFAPAYTPTEEYENEEESGDSDASETDEETDYAYQGYHDALDRIAQNSNIDPDVLSQAMALAFKAGEEAADQAVDEEEESDQIFTKDEWWDLMKTLMDAGEEEYARRIASEKTFA